MTAQVEILTNGPADARRRVEKFRNGCQMSKREFGTLKFVSQKGDKVCIATDKHTVFIDLELWQHLAGL